MKSYVVPIPLWDNNYAISSEGIVYKMPESRRLLTFIDTEGNKYIRIFYHEGYNFSYDTYLISDLLDLVTGVTTKAPVPASDEVDDGLLLVKRELNWRFYHYPPMRLKWKRHNYDKYLAALDERQRRALFRSMRSRTRRDPLHVSESQKKKLEQAGLSTLATDPMIDYNDPLCQVVQFKAKLKKPEKQQLLKVA